MAALLSFGQDRRWRRAMVSEIEVGEGGHALDVATGTGAVAVALARRTQGRVTGIDQSERMLRTGLRTISSAGLDGRVRLLLGQAERLPFRDSSFDAVTFTYLLRYVDDPASTLAELVRVLRPGGTLANLEFHVPQRTVWRALWLAYTRAALPLAGMAVSAGWREVGRFLGPSISAFYRRHPLSSQISWWGAAGLADVRWRVMSLGGGVVIRGIKDGP